MLSDDLLGHKRQPAEEQQRHDDGIVQVPDDRDKVWDEVDGRERVRDSAAK